MTTGLIMLQLFDENQNLVTLEKGIIKDQKSIIIIKNLKPAKYAIRYFHDENLNGKLETNKIGKPTEGYGFSNNAYGMSGPNLSGIGFLKSGRIKRLTLIPNINQIEFLIL